MFPEVLVVCRAPHARRSLAQLQVFEYEPAVPYNTKCNITLKHNLTADFLQNMGRGGV